MFEKEAEDFLKKSLKVDDDEFDFFKNEASCKEEIKRLTDFIEPREKRIAELEKENAELKANNSFLNNLVREKEQRGLEIQEDLLMENEKLKEQCLILADCNTCHSTCKNENVEMKKQLIKAKEIIKKFLEFVNNEVEFDPEHPQEHTDLWNELCEKAEEILKESE